MTSVDRAAAAIARGLGHRLFVWATVAWFVVQGALVAATARLSIYDEAYHLAAVEAFSRRWTPFLEQVPGDGPVGDIERYGSYLYHYAMSFPWRWMSAAGIDGDGRVIGLRLITVALVAAALLVWRAVFRELGASPAVANVATALVSQVPFVVVLAGSVTYDNLVFLLVGAIFLYAVRLCRADEVSGALWLKFVVVIGLGCLTKYTVLPLVPVVFLTAVVRQALLLRSRGSRRPRHAASTSDSSWFVLPTSRRARLALLALSVGCVSVVALVAERYVGNLLMYGSLAPSCELVHASDICGQYAPLARNLRLDSEFVGVPTSISGAVSYFAGTWYPLMLRYSTLVGVVVDNRATTSLGPNMAGVLLTAAVPAVLVVLVLSAGILRRTRGIVMLLASSGLYVGALFVQNYSDYSRLGEAVGVSGRYLLIVLPVVVGALCIGVARILGATGEHGGAAAKAGAVLLAAALLTQGGGILSFAWAVEDHWLRNPDSVVGRAVSGLHEVAHGVIVPDELVPDPRE